MTTKDTILTFERLDKKRPDTLRPLLLADPSDLVDKYLISSEVFIARQNQETIGVIVLFQLTIGTVEIKNIAVKSEFQGQGIGSYLIENAIKVASLNKHKRICIGTANSSVGQLYLYQKPGFEITEIKKDFFTHNCPEPIYENRIQAKHMLVLNKTTSVERKI